MRIPTVQNMQSRKGTYNNVANQYILTMFNSKGERTRIFQSYQTIIATITYKGNGDKVVRLDKDAWNYSVTTSSYRNIFLNETTAETRKKIKLGIYKLANLNGGSR